MDSDEPLQPISSNSPIPIVLIKITQYTVTISPVSPKIRGRKSEQHKRKQHEDNRQKYHTILSKSHLYTGKIPEYHRQIHPRHPHLHRLAGSAGTERHHQRMRDPLQKTSRSQIHAVQRQQHAHRLKRLLRIHRLARLFRHDL